MIKTAIHKQPPVVVEFYSRGKRASKKFTDPHAAKRFYTAKSKAGKNRKLKKSARTATKTTKAKKTASGKPTRPPGVRLVKSAPYAAGLVLKKHGLEAGVTEDMVVEVGKIVGRQNPHQDWFNVRWRYGASVRGGRHDVPR